MRSWIRTVLNVQVWGSASTCIILQKVQRPPSTRAHRINFKRWYPTYQIKTQQLRSSSAPRHSHIASPASSWSLSNRPRPPSSKLLLLGNGHNNSSRQVLQESTTTWPLVPSWRGPWSGMVECRLYCSLDFIQMARLLLVATHCSIDVSVRPALYSNWSCYDQFFVSAGARKQGSPKEIKSIEQDACQTCLRGLALNSSSYHPKKLRSKWAINRYIYVFISSFTLNLIVFLAHLAHGGSYGYHSFKADYHHEC